MSHIDNAQTYSTKSSVLAHHMVKVTLSYHENSPYDSFYHTWFDDFLIRIIVTGFIYYNSCNKLN
jgi:hypothetical protein